MRRSKRKMKKDIAWFGNYLRTRLELAEETSPYISLDGEAQRVQVAAFRDALDIYERRVERGIGGQQ